MNDLLDAGRDLIQALKTERDDLKVRMHLASADLRDKLDLEWNNIEKKWAEIKATTKQLNNDVTTITSVIEDDLEDVTEHLTDNSKALLNEIREGYKRIRSTLKK